MAKQGSHAGAVKNKNGLRPGAAKKVMRRVEQARASYARAEERVADLRVRLTRAEEKLARRAACLSAAEETLAALAAAPGLDASGPAEEMNEIAAAALMVQEDRGDATGGPVADTLTTPAAHEAVSPDGAMTPPDVATEPVATAQSAAHDAGARRSRSRRKPSSQGKS